MIRLDVNWRQPIVRVWTFARNKRNKSEECWLHHRRDDELDSPLSRCLRNPGAEHWSEIHIRNGPSWGKTYSPSLPFFLLYHFELKRATRCESFSSFLAELMPVPNCRLGRSCERSETAVVSSTRTRVMQFGIQPLLQKIFHPSCWWFRLALQKHRNLIGGTEILGWVNFHKMQHVRSCSFCRMIYDDTIFLWLAWPFGDDILVLSVSDFLGDHNIYFGDQ